MSDTQEERQEKNRRAVESMRLAQANMKATLSRIERLEYRLKQAADNLKRASEFIGENVYVYDGKKTVRKLVAEYEAEARADL